MSIRDVLSGLLGGLGRERAPRAERYVTHGFQCPFGELLDLSRTGCKVLVGRRPEVHVNQVIPMTLRTPFQQLMVHGRVAWVRRLRQGWSMGVQFVNMTPSLEEAMELLARHGFVDAGSFGPTRGVRNAKPSGGPTRPIITAEVEVEDLYALLGVSAEADAEELHRAYRAMAKKYHPDVNGSLEAAQRFADARKAYSILSDPRARARYDEMYRRGRRAA
jgi:hypothetical protein